MHWTEEDELNRPQSSGGKLFYDGKRTGRKAFEEKYISDLQRVAKEDKPTVTRATRSDVEDLTPRHRTALIRTLTLAHPKFTQQSVVQRSTECWDPMTQLLSHAYMEQPKKPQPKPRPVSARNSVRMVALMRQAQGKQQRAWH